MKESREFLQKIGMPDGDAYDLPTSEKRFPDDCQYRYEVYGIQNPAEMKALIDEVQKESLIVHRITQTTGIMNLTDREIKDMVSMAREYGAQLLLAVGPRATTDLSPSVSTEMGETLGNRLRGQEQIIRAMEDVKLGVNFGCRHFLLYDEGSLWVFNKMRKMGEIPPDCHFKFSAYSGYGNPCSLNLIEENGADSVNTTWDLELPMLAAIRQAVDIPMDVHIVTSQKTGGFIRFYEAPLMIKVAAPIYLKLGAIAPSFNTPESKAMAKVRQIRLTMEMVEKYYPEAKLSPQGSIA